MKLNIKGIVIVCTLLMAFGTTSCHRGGSCPAYAGHANTTVSMARFSDGKKAHQKKSNRYKSNGRKRKRTRRKLFKSKY